MFTTNFLSSPENQAKIRAVHEASQCKEALAKARQEALKSACRRKRNKEKEKNHLQSRYCKSETTTNGSKGGSGRGRGRGRGRERGSIDAPKL